MKMKKDLCLLGKAKMDPIAFQDMSYSRGNQCWVCGNENPHGLYIKSYCGRWGRCSKSSKTDISSERQPCRYAAAWKSNRHEEIIAGKIGDVPEIMKFPVWRVFFRQKKLSQHFRLLLYIHRFWRINNRWDMVSIY